MNTPERIRIKDIAKMADVSVGTVDRVIHGRSGVSEASRKPRGRNSGETELPAQYVRQRIGFQQEVRLCLPATPARNRRILDRSGKRHTRSADHLLGFQHHREAEVLRPVRLPAPSPGKPAVSWK